MSFSGRDRIVDCLAFWPHSDSCQTKIPSGMLPVTVARGKAGLKNSAVKLNAVIQK